MARPKNDGKGRMGGRQKGTGNKVTEETRKSFQAIFDNNIEYVQKHLDALAKAEEHDRWLVHFEKISEFVTPKKAAIKVEDEAKRSDLRSEIASTIYSED